MSHSVSNHGVPRGIIVPMVTPLADADRIDVEGLERLVDRLLTGGVHGLFLLGTCSEGPSLTREAQRELVTRACRLASGRAAVLVCATSASLGESLGLARHAADAGADAVVFAPPYYFPLTQPELAAAIERLASAAPLPVMLYNTPGIAKIGFAIDTLRRLLEHPNIVGLKDSSGDMEYFREVRELTRSRDDWRLLVGPEHLLPEVIELGGDGGVSGGANVWPELFVQIYEAARAGFDDELATLRSNAALLGHIYTVGRFDAASVVKGLKAALAHLGVCSGYVSPPLEPLTASEKAEVGRILDSLKLTRAAAQAVAIQQQ
jgi:dihydrodipicolinate synthase/N-acetylneuraminate lyase